MTLGSSQLVLLVFLLWCICQQALASIYRIEDDLFVQVYVLQVVSEPCEGNLL